MGFIRNFFEKIFGKKDEESVVFKEEELTKERKKEINNKLMEGSNELLEKIKLKKKAGEEEKEIKIQFKSLDDALSKVGDKEVVLIINDLRNRRKDFSIRGISSAVFKSNVEVLELLKQEVFSFLMGIKQDLGDRLSALRKAGKKVNSIRYRWLSLPLKIKVLNSDFRKRDFDKVMNLIEGLDNSLRIREKKLEEQIALKEKIAREKEMKEKAAKAEKKVKVG